MKLAKFSLFIQQKISNQVAVDLLILENFSKDKKNENIFKQDILNRIKNQKTKKKPINISSN